MSGVLTGLCLYMHTWVRFVFLFQTDIKSHNMSVWVVFLSWCNLLPPLSLRWQGDYAIMKLMSGQIVWTKKGMIATSLRIDLIKEIFIIVLQPN